VSSLFGSQLPGQARKISDQEQKPCDQPQTPKKKKKASDELSTVEAIQELNRFCVYEIADPNKKLADLPFPPAVSAELVRFDQDCAAISPASDKVASIATWNDVSNHFLSQVGAKSLSIYHRLGVRLAFLDTQQDGKGAPTMPGNFWHGYTLTHIARQLVCSSESDEDCAAQITTRLALPYVHFDAKSRTLSQIDTKQGGHIGMQSDLAKAITGEVRSWQSEDPQRHLVLNISVAWDPKLFGGLDKAQLSEMRAGTQAVYDALQYARSLDVLVLAAAGNRTECSGYGPLLPAAWEEGIAHEPSCEKNPEASLVYAVGGVRSDGRPLANARDGGIPRRVAYGENAIVACPVPILHTAALTGSSIATAVASSIAAVVWDSFPQLSPEEVMDLLDSSGDELKVVDGTGREWSREADFWFRAGANASPERPTVHRLSLCTALKEACGRYPDEFCPLDPSSCETWDPSEPVFPHWCSSPPSATCDPWLHPQPGDPPCPSPNCPPGG